MKTLYLGYDTLENDMRSIVDKMMSRASKIALSHVAFLFISIPPILIFAFHVPPGWGLDEQVHIARAYQISEGNIYPDKLQSDSSYGGSLPSSLVNALNYGHLESNSVQREQLSISKRQDIRDPSMNQGLLDVSLNPNSTTLYDFGPTGPYTPLVYSGSSTGFFLARSLDLSVGNSVIFAKLLQASLYIVLCFISLYLLRSYKVRWIVFLVALLPSSIYQAATINADSTTIGIVLLFFSVMIRIYTSSVVVSNRMLALMAASSIGIAFTKPSYAVLLLLLLLIPNQVFSSSARRRLFTVGTFTASLITLVLISLKGMQYSDSIGLYRGAETAANINLLGQVKWTLFNPIEFLQVLIDSSLRNASEWQSSLVGLLGYNTVPVPHPLMMMLILALAIAMLYAEKLTRAHSIQFAVVGLLSLFAVVYILYGTFNTVGSDAILGVQGRYFVPCIPFLVIGLAGLLPLSIRAEKHKFGLMMIGTAIIVLYVTTWIYLQYLY